MLFSAGTQWWIAGTQWWIEARILSIVEWVSHILSHNWYTGFHVGVSSTELIVNQLFFLYTPPVCGFTNLNRSCKSSIPFLIRMPENTLKCTLVFLNVLEEQNKNLTYVLWGIQAKSGWRVFLFGKSYIYTFRESLYIYTFRESLYVYTFRESLCLKLPQLSSHTHTFLWFAVFPVTKQGYG